MSACSHGSSEAHAPEQTMEPWIPTPPTLPAPATPAVRHHPPPAKPLRFPLAVTCHLPSGVLPCICVGSMRRHGQGRLFKRTERRRRVACYPPSGRARADLVARDLVDFGESCRPSAHHIAAAARCVRYGGCGMCPGVSVVSCPDLLLGAVSATNADLCRQLLLLFWGSSGLLTGWGSRCHTLALGWGRAPLFVGARLRPEVRGRGATRAQCQRGRPAPS